MGCLACRLEAVKFTEPEARDDELLLGMTSR
jgi:hypothetical protein